MCYYIFKNIKQWRRTCSYIQQAMANTSKDDIELRAVSVFRSKGGKEVYPDRTILKKFEDLGFIKDLYISKNHIVYGLNYLYTYMQLKQAYLPMLCLAQW